MSHINNSQNLSIKYFFRSRCRLCNVKILGDDFDDDIESWNHRESDSNEGYKFWGDPCIARSGRSRTDKLNIFQCCETCANYDIELHEALDEKRRFTRIEIDRCICGAVKLWSIECCVQCSIRSRMLSRAEAEQKLMSKALVELRRTLKNCKDLTQTTEI